jgi:hypothetical protein
MQLGKCLTTLSLSAGLSLSTAAFVPVIYAQAGGTTNAPGSNTGSITSPSTGGGSMGGVAGNAPGGSMGNATTGTSGDSGTSNAPAGPPADPTTVGDPSMNNGMPNGAVPNSGAPNPMSGNSAGVGSSTTTQ